MKKSRLVILTLITLVLTFLFSGISGIYHFGSIPTLLTTVYLVCIFSIFEYLLVSTTYILRKLIKKEKLGIKLDRRLTYARTKEIIYICVS